ncbi:peptidase S8/S53 domain-containing protein [Rhizoctonia solani]|nr:peptidase S8/S53 domain-containing protein [Rhizoctonia solani]
MPRALSLLYSSLSLVALSISVVNAVPVSQINGDAQPGSYIVVLKETASAKTHVASMKGKFATAQATTKSHVTYDYDFMNSYSAELDDNDLKELTQSPDVEMIVPDSMKDAPWGLSRVSSKTKLPAGSSADRLNYNFERLPSPAGVDVYVLDTGVNIHHVDFDGRARWGKTFGPYKNQDGHGHGTHVAGTVAGKRWGVAKAASIVAVKVLSDEGPGKTSDIIAGVNWAVAEAKRKGRPSVINMSLGSSANEAMDRAVVKAVAAGVHVVVSAGNDNVDAANASPARVPTVITVGATSITDERWVWSNSSGSNFGKSVDIFAPGDEITSAAKTNTGVTVKTGTSMAAPHVAGLIAYLLATEGRRTPANMLARIKHLAPDGVLKGIPSDTRNEMIWNGQ